MSFSEEERLVTIPARAGETFITASAARVTLNHPHACGGDLRQRAWPRHAQAFDDQRDGMMIRTFSAVAALLASSAAASQQAPTAAEMAACAEVADSTDRLACFDRLASRSAATEPPKVDDSANNSPSPPPSAAQAPAASRGAWQVSENVSPIDDSRRVFLRLQADEPHRDRFGQAAHAVLMLRCSERRTEAFVNWGTYIGSREQGVIVRIGSNPATTQSWGASTDGRAIFHPRPVPWIRDLMRAETVFVQTTPFGESPVSARFTLSGLADAVKPLREACGW